MRTPKLIAFHLPQFHPIPENDDWWGKGFTEWTNVRRGRPFYGGHRQPQFPGELGFYDLCDPDVRARQAEMAQGYGVHAFCYYYYWFAGKRLLERPIDAMLAGGPPDMPFCLCWANESWTRRWDGKEQEILIAQQHSPDDDIAIARDLIRHFSDQRYLRVAGRPLMIVYRIDLLPDPSATAERWRQECRRAGIGEIYLCTVRRFGSPDAARFGFDAVVDFPPHGCIGAQVNSAVPDLDPAFRGRIFDYMDVVGDALQRRDRRLPNFPGVMPSWDNTARKLERAYIFHGASPLRYRAWLAEAIRRASEDALLPEPLVFINAWNEWAEGCHLEPDAEYGAAWLQATLAARSDALSQERLWPTFNRAFPVLDSTRERDLAGAPLHDAMAALESSRTFGVAPSASEQLVASVRRRVEPSAPLRRAALPIARRLGLAD